MNKIEEIVTSASRYGLYSIVDAHQDVMSEKFCGEGVPNFAAVDDVSSWEAFPRPLQPEAYKVDANGIPSREDCAKHSWQAYYGKCLCHHVEMLLEFHVRVYQAHSLWQGRFRYESRVFMMMVISRSMFTEAILLEPLPKRARCCRIVCCTLGTYGRTVQRQRCRDRFRNLE